LIRLPFRVRCQSLQQPRRNGFRGGERHGLSCYEDLL
jgi:hypothetical protein